jgi:DNA-binding NtrC family response regulator
MGLFPIGARANWRIVAYPDEGRFDGGAARQVVPLTGVRILVVDDAADYASILADVLKPHGIEVVPAGSVEQALTLLQTERVDLVLTDLCLPGASGIDLARELRRRDRSLPVILVTGSGSVHHAVEALKQGANDYLQKPVDPARLIALIRALLNADGATETEEVDQSGFAVAFEGMLGGSPAMQKVFERIRRVASTPAPVLIIGESGTGKDLVARALHNRSRRRAGPFIPVHTGAVPRDLVANELFGHERGAFTGALASSEGKFAAAEGGTLFLDEVGTMDPATQICLLRVLETHRYTRVGANREEKADVRIVAATNSDLLDLVEQRVFREDLFYRLNVLTIALPPLRERKEDIIPLAERFLRLAAKRYGLLAKTLSPEAANKLIQHHWPGNVRELRNTMDQAAVLARGEAVAGNEIDFVPARIAAFQGSELASSPASTVDVAVTLPAPPEREPEDDRVPVKTNELATGDDDDHPMVVRVQIGTPMAEVERLLILKTLKAASGNKQRTARILGISRRGLYVRLASYGSFTAPEDKSPENSTS